MDPEKAIETYRNIIAASPQLRRDALVRIGKVHRRMKAYDAEIKAYEDALQAPPGETGVKNAELQFLIADTYEIMNLRDKALEAYFKVPYLYPQETSWGVKAYLRVGKIYENQEDWDKAVTAYQKVADMNVEESKFALERLDWVSQNRGK
ncbi:MAG: tetratricopeptide repeat protein [Elusimicrobia bacterium]|nr:tetratricopeptide repeat protein [Elusimicrobiota bacterium]